MGIKNMFDKLGRKVSGARVTVLNSKYEPAFDSPFLDVDLLHYVITSARGGSVTALFALYRDMVLTDSHLQAEFNKRKLAVIGDSLRFLPYEKKDPNDVAAAAFCERQLLDLDDRFVLACSHALDASMWPVSVVEKVYESDGNGFNLVDLVPVPYHLLDYSSGALRIRATKPDGEPTGETVDADPARYIIHRGHLMASIPDQWGGPMRALVFWWMLSALSRDWWSRYLEKYGTPFIVAHYDPADSASKTVLESAMAAATRLLGMAVGSSTNVELIEAAKGGDAAYKTFIDMCNAEKSKLILGQTLSSTASATGMNSGVSDLQSEVRQDIRKFDATRLASTIRGQLLDQLCQANGLPGRTPFVIWGSESVASLKATADLLASLKGGGLEVDDPGIDPLSDRVGFALRRAAPGVGVPGAPFLSATYPPTRRLI